MESIIERTKLFGGIINFHEIYKIPLKTNNFWLVFSILIFFSCSRYKEETIVIKEMIRGSALNFEADKQSAVFIVPATCSSCVGPVKEFISKINSPKFIIIGSCYSSRDFRMSFSEHELENKNYIIDSEGQAFRYGLVDNGARLYFFKGGKIIDAKIVSCTEPNLLKLTLEFLGKD